MYHTTHTQHPVNGESFAGLNFHSFHIMDFPSNTFTVQGQGAYVLYLE